MHAYLVGAAVLEAACGHGQCGGLPEGGVHTGLSHFCLIAGGIERRPDVAAIARGSLLTNTDVIAQQGRGTLTIGCAVPANHHLATFLVHHHCGGCRGCGIGIVTLKQKEPQILVVGHSVGIGIGKGCRRPAARLAPDAHLAFVAEGNLLPVVAEREFIGLYTLVIGLAVKVEVDGNNVFTQRLNLGKGSVSQIAYDAFMVIAY